MQLVLRSVAARTFRDSYSGLQGIAPPKRTRHAGWVDRVTGAACWPLPAIIRVMIVKDLRLFRRDPMQWTQFAIFFGLLVLYFLNVRRFDYTGVMEQWITAMSFLNVGVVGLLLSTFTTRFVFPAISLEGRRFWILGTAPIARDTIIWGKFWFAWLGGWPVCALLVFVSDVALGIWRRSWVGVAVHQFQCLLLCLGLAALAVGFGARLPNLRETSPARIASGFGGTLNLVLSSLFVVGTMLVTAVPAFCWMESIWRFRPLLWNNFGWRGELALGSDFSLAAGLAAGALLCLISTLWPLRVGLQSFRALEP
jgi:ABC-2 type transport system permease protein